MADGNRPVRTIKALAKALGPRWGEIESIELGGLKLRFRQGSVPVQPSPSAPAPGTDQKQKQVPEPPISDADLVLDVPKGMLVPVYGPDPEAN